VAVQLERLLEAALAEQHAAERAMGAREARLRGKRAAQGVFCFGRAHQLLQHHAVVVERLGPVRALQQHRLQLARGARRVALRFEHVE